jgi:Ca2+-binding EF-hand superfamily protein
MTFRCHPFAFGLVLFATSLDAGPAARPLPIASAGMVSKLSALFQSRDTDGNGLLSPIEWRISAPALRLPLQFLKIDRNRDGAVSFSEFARALGRRLPSGASVPVDRAKRSFARLDANADGKVTYVELDNSDRLGNFEIQDWFDGVDGDGNGAIDLGEWRLPDYSRYVGLPLEAAEALAMLEDRRHRVISIDGEPLIVTMDYSPFRVNFTVVADVVTAATGG